MSWSGLRTSPLAGRLLVAALAVFLGALAHFGLHRPLINDEAIELQVAEGLPLDRFYFFVPGEAYPRGLIVPLESLGPYVNRAFFAVTRPWATTRDGFTVPVRCLHLVAFAAGCLLIYELARRHWGPARALFAGFCAAGSAYAMLMNQFLTRNAFSLFWGALVLWLLERWMRRPTEFRWALSCAVALAAGCWTYTIFKPFALAVYAALFIGWVRWSRRRFDFAPIAVSAGVFGACLVGLIVAGGSGLAFYFHRGGYALGGSAQYAHNLLLTLASPVHYPAHGEFLEEDVHVMIGRAILSPLLGPFVFASVAAGLLARQPLPFLAATLWLCGMALCAIAGPNLKYQHAFFPLSLLLACGGLFGAADLLSESWPRASAPLFLAVCVGWELWNVFAIFPRSDRFAMNRFAPIVAARGLEAARRNPGAVVLQPNLGYDILNWYLWPRERARDVRAYAETPDMIADLTAHPLPAPVLLLVDYPPDSLFPALGWTPPPGMRIVNVRDP